MTLVLWDVDHCVFSFLFTNGEFQLCICVGAKLKLVAASTINSSQSQQKIASSALPLNLTTSSCTSPLSLNTESMEQGK